MALCCPGLWLMAAIQPEKFPWVGASWLTQRRNSLLLSVELTEQGGVWVIVRVSVCVHARAREIDRERERERNSFLCMSVSMCVHVGLPLLCMNRHAWASLSTCFKLSVKVTACPRPGIQVTWIISQKWPCTHKHSSLSFFFFFPMDNRNLLLYDGNHSRQQYVTFIWNIGSFTDRLALFLWYGNYGRWWGYYSCTLSYVKVNSCCINGKVLILNTRIACPLLLKIKWQWESKAGEQRGGRREKQPKMRVGLRNTDNWSVPFTKRLL